MYGQASGEPDRNSAESLQENESSEDEMESNEGRQPTNFLSSNPFAALTDE